MGYPSWIHLKFKSHQISFARECPIMVNLCTEQDSITGCLFWTNGSLWNLNIRWVSKGWYCITIDPCVLYSTCESSFRWLDAKETCWSYVSFTISHRFLPRLGISSWHDIIGRANVVYLSVNYNRLYCIISFVSWENCMKFGISNFKPNFPDWWLGYLSWNCPLMNVTGSHWW